jgi:hypothetical protein
MTDRPIIFSAPMIRALLAGTKTQTRRLLKPVWVEDAISTFTGWMPERVARERWVLKCNGIGATISVRYAAGDRLWVREAYAKDDLIDTGARYVATDAISDLRRKHPSIHMPRWASRLTLTVTDVRVQRLQDISEKDALAEGITAQSMIIGSHCARGVHTEVHGERFFSGTEPHDHDGYDDGIDAYAALWNRLHGDGAWDANPWVVAVSFQVLIGNIDEVPA